jgi:hypothetical protein
MFDKNFIFFKTSMLGSYMNDRLSSVHNIFKSKEIDLDKKNYDTKLIHQNYNKKFYNEFKKRNIYCNKNYTSYEQIKFFLNKIFVNGY